MFLLKLKLKIVAIRLTILKLMIRIFKLKRKKESSYGVSIIYQIREIAVQYDVDPDLAVRVARCESSLNPKARNVNRLGSVDRGLYQWNDRYHPEVSEHCADNVECATRRFCMAVKEGHLDWWNASRDCWSK